MSKDKDPGARLDVHLREISGGAIVAFGMKGIAFCGTFLLSVAAARTLGAKLAGFYFLSLTIVTVVSTLARLGVEKPLVRYVATFHAAADTASIRGFAAASAGMTSLVAVATAFAISLCADWLAVRVFNEPGLAPVLAVMAWAIPGLTFAASCLSRSKACAGSHCTCSTFPRWHRCLRSRSTSRLASRALKSRWRWRPSRPLP